MKRDLKINYGILDDIINQLGIYKRSLNDMESSLSTITTYIEQNHGESIEAWKDRMKGSKEQMAEYETQINDLLKLFQGYVDETTAYITPLQRNTMMRVDRNDIYWNLKQMDSGISNNVRKAIRQTNKSPSNWGFWEDVTDKEKEASSINKSKIVSIRSDIEQTNNRLNHKMDQLWDLYNSKVKKYENMDDEYNDKASVLKAKYTNFFEGFWDSLESDFNFVKDLVVGLFTGLIDIVVGLATLVFDAGIVAVSNQIPDIIEPKFLKDAAIERIDSFYTMVQQIVEDPFSVVEGIGQSFSDSVEEDGIVYVTGNFAAGFVPIVGWSKYARVGKVIDTDKAKKPVNNTANKEGKMVDPVELLLVNGKKIGIEFTNGVIDGMRIFMKMLQGRTENVAFSGVPGGGNIYKVIDETDDTIKRAKVETVKGKGIDNAKDITKLTVDDIPTAKSGNFNKFFNSLTSSELDELWKDKKIRKKIERQLREPGGLHEWHLVSRAPQFKYWNIGAEEIKDLRTAISDVKFVNPNGVHGGLGSTKAHNELLAIIDTSSDYNTFVRRLNNWANYRLEGGVTSLPQGLRLK
ncbi:hypothetical protein [Paucisalibacillus globulus]|uniref:hypothetical protein n=1 Tax=Paucisalibacillus globulus TaxID=351095 RepID=UPI000403D331|nr:hypothetical protein [Paucisalibacillus globulus]